VGLDYDDVAIACTFSMPDRSRSADDDAGSEPPKAPTGMAQNVGHCAQTAGPHVDVDIDVAQKVTISLSAVPKSLHIRIERGGTTLRDLRVTPAYAVLQPNGPECGPTCHQATVPIALP
jgi:hypothetical protein